MGTQSRTLKADYRPHLEKLGGLWRLLWIGGLRPAPENPTGYHVQLHFAWAGSGEKAPITRWTSFGTLPLLRLQSLWEHGTLREHAPWDLRRFQVEGHGRVGVAPWTPGDPASDLLSREDYRFQKLRDLAPCGVFNAADGEQLIVPAWEVLRAWYLFDPNVMPAVLAGGIRHVGSLSRAVQPWLEGTAYLADGTPQYVRPRWMSDHQAARMARLVFDDRAHDQAYDIHRQLMVAKNSSIRAADGLPMLPMPAILPPYTGFAEWTVDCRQISPAPNGARRWLVMSLEGAKVPASFSRLQLVRGADARTGANRDELEVSSYVRHGKAPIDPGSDPAVRLLGAAPDPKVAPVPLAGFGFDDGMFETLVLDVKDKPEQAARSLQVASDPVVIAGGAVDPAASTGRKVARLEIQDDARRLSPEDLLQRTVTAFHAVVASARHQPQPATWNARLVRKGTGDTYHVVARGWRRHFAILEVEVQGRYAYAIDAQRLSGRSKEEFAILLCRQVDGYPLMSNMWDAWFKHFPAARGNAWTGSGIMPRVVMVSPRRFKHQPQPRDADHGAVTRRLAERLEARLREFARS